MCHIDQHIGLSETENGQISYCKGCRSFSLVYKSCCASFTKKEMSDFVQLLDGLRSEDFQYYVLGVPKAVVKNQFAYIGFCLDVDEVKDLRDSINQALSLFEGFNVIYK